MTNLVIGFYLGGAFLTALMVEGPPLNRILSAAFWPTFPFWPGRF